MTGQPPRRPDQRAHERVKVNHEFKNIDAFLSEYVSDISHGGVFIRSRSPLAVGTRVELRFTIILDDVETIEGEGEVVRAVPPDEGPIAGMGVSFTQLTERSQTVIERLIAYREQLERSIVVVDEQASAADGDTPLLQKLEPLDDDEPAGG